MPRRRWRAALAACALLCVAHAASAGAPPRALTPREAAAWTRLVVQADVARAAGKWAELERLTRRRAAIEEVAYGSEAPVTAASYSWIAQALARQGRDSDAEPFYRRALIIDRKALGEG